MTSQEEWSIVANRKGRFVCWKLTIMKCHTKREMKGAKSVTVKSGKLVTQDICPTKLRSVLGVEVGSQVYDIDKERV